MSSVSRRARGPVGSIGSRERRWTTRAAPLVRPSLAFLIAVTVLLLGACSSALAAPALITDRYPLAGERSELALDGPSTLIAGYENQTTNVVRRFTSGQAPKTIARATIKPESGEFGDAMYFVASASRILLYDHGSSYTYKGQGELRYERLLTGPLDGPLTALGNPCQITPTLDPRVTSEAGIPAHSAIAIDGELVGYDSFGCLVLEDYASGVKRVIPLEATLDPVFNGVLQSRSGGTTLRVAGRLIAYRANPQGGEGPASVVVYNFDTGAEVYSVPLPEESTTFDLEPNGTLVMANLSSCQATVSTVVDPSPTPLGISACKIRGLLDGRALVVVAGPGGDQQLAWTSLQAPAVHPIADLGPHGVFEQSLPDMNETDVVYAQAGCWAAEIYQTALAEPGAPPRPPTTCPVGVSPNTAQLTSKTLRVRLHCPLGCYGNLDAHVGNARQVRTQEGGRSIIGDGLPNISIAPGGYETFTLLPGEAEEGAPTPRALVRKLRRKQRVFLRLDVDIDTPVNEAFGDSLSSEEEATRLGLVYRTYRHFVVPIRLQQPASRRHRHGRV